MVPEDYCIFLVNRKLVGSITKMFSLVYKIFLTKMLGLSSSQSQSHSVIKVILMTKQMSPFE